MKENKDTFNINFKSSAQKEMWKKKNPKVLRFIVDEREGEITLDEKALDMVLGLDEGVADFIGAASKAKVDGKEEFEFAGKTYPVKISDKVAKKVSKAMKEGTFGIPYPTNEYHKKSNAQLKSISENSFKQSVRVRFADRELGQKLINESNVAETILNWRIYGKGTQGMPVIQESNEEIDEGIIGDFFKKFTAAGRADLKQKEAEVKQKMADALEKIKDAKDRIKALRDSYKDTKKALSGDVSDSEKQRLQARLDSLEKRAKSQEEEIESQKETIERQKEEITKAAEKVAGKAAGEGEPPEKGAGKAGGEGEPAGGGEPKEPKEGEPAGGGEPKEPKEGEPKEPKEGEPKEPKEGEPKEPKEGEPKEPKKESFIPHWVPKSIQLEGVADFIGAASKAAVDGKEEFEFAGKKYKVTINKKVANKVAKAMEEGIVERRERPDEKTIDILKKIAKTGASNMWNLVEPYWIGRMPTSDDHNQKSNMSTAKKILKKYGIKESTEIQEEKLNPKNYVYTSEPKNDLMGVVTKVSGAKPYHVAIVDENNVIQKDVGKYTTIDSARKILNQRKLYENFDYNPMTKKDELEPRSVGEKRFKDQHVLRKFDPYIGKYDDELEAEMEAVVNEESNDIDDNKLNILIRSGLLDVNKLPLIKRLVKKLKSDEKINLPDEREILIRLVRTLLSIITSDVTIYQKTKRIVSENLNEKSVSQQQQKLMGLAYAYKKGEVPESEVSDEVKKIADTMTMKDLKDFASTKHKGLPVSKEQLEIDEDIDSEEREMALRQLHFIQYAAEEIMDYFKSGYEVEPWFESKLSGMHEKIKGLHSYIEGNKRLNDAMSKDEM